MIAKTWTVYLIEKQKIKNMILITLCSLDTMTKLIQNIKMSNIVCYDIFLKLYGNEAINKSSLGGNYILPVGLTGSGSGLDGSGSGFTSGSGSGPKKIDMF